MPIHIKIFGGKCSRVFARTRWIVEEKTLIVSLDNASRRELNAAVRQALKANVRYAHGSKNVGIEAGEYREVLQEFSAGDSVQFISLDNSLGTANRDLAVIESIASGGPITELLDAYRRVKFNAHQHRHFDHGYAVTSCSAQGLAAERVLVNADTGVHPDLLNSRFGYVSVSRARHEATVFTDDVTKLNL